MSPTAPTDSSWVYDFYRLGQSLVLTHEPAIVQRIILEHIVQAVCAQSGSLVLADAGRPETLVLVAGIAVPPEAIGQRIVRGEGVLGWVAEHDEALILNGDIASDPRFKSLQREKRDRVPASALCWPLKGSKGRLIGIISANRGVGDPPFTAADLAHGQTLGNLITLLIENQWLYERQKQRIEELSQLNHQMRLMHQRLEKAHQQLLHAEKSALLGQLAAGVAHEINNPLGYVYSNLGTLRGYIEKMFRDPAATRLDPSERDYLSADSCALIADCLEGIERIRYIVRDLQAFSRIDDAGWQIRSLHAELESALKIVLHNAPPSVSIIRRLGELPDIECLPARLNQILVNILKNALQASGPDAVIVIETGTEREEVWMTVTDNGSGIRPEIMNRVFEPFFTTKPVGQGVGLGLALVYNLVRKHQGRIGIESQPGAGTRVTLHFPVRQTELEPQE